jgi:hypothetical protein
MLYCDVQCTLYVALLFTLSLVIIFAARLVFGDFEHFGGYPSGVKKNRKFHALCVWFCYVLVLCVILC